MYEYVARVVSVHDGDTFRADVDLGFGVWIADQPFRLFGVQAWELGKPGGIAARDYVRSLLPAGAEIVIKTRKDSREKYGRMLATVLCTAGDLGDALIAAGHAVAWDGQGPKPEQLALFEHPVVEPDSEIVSPERARWQMGYALAKSWRPLPPRRPI